MEDNACFILGDETVRPKNPAAQTSTASGVNILFILIHD